MNRPEGDLARGHPAKPEDRAESVSAFTRRVKQLLESGMGEGWVCGEVSNLRAYPSGHVYFSIKDAGAQLSCVLFRGDAARQKVELRDGAQVVLGGRISVYETRGQYQLIVRSVVEAGVGRLQREFEALKKKLSDEGLFERDRKRALPGLIQQVGIITSSTGAAVQDFISIMRRRGWRGRLVVLPAKVQGKGAAQEIVAMVERAQAMGGFDVLVVGRGGGSLEDLWAFNEEMVVRVIADCQIPVISAVGHEIDFTLTDFAADVRAETPSGAAELLSSRAAECRERVATGGERLQKAVQDRIESCQHLCANLRDRLRLLTPRSQIEQGWLRRDDVGNRLQAAAAAVLARFRSRLQQQAPGVALQVPRQRVERESRQLLSLRKRLHSVSPRSVLQRGYAIMRDEQDSPVTRREAMASDTAYEAEFADGRVRMKTAREN